jgi:translation initiation factor eIF-2B subunit epsilon
MNIIRSDPFILISGDVVSNINLGNAIAVHKQKRKEDINNVMTVVLKKVQSKSALTPLLDDLVVGMDAATSQIVLFDNTIENSSVSLPLGLLKEHISTQIHKDLLDCHIDICSPELMVQFSDNFDYQVGFIFTSLCCVFFGVFI